MVVAERGGAMMSSFERSQEREKRGRGYQNRTRANRGKGEYKSWSFGHFAKT